MTNSIKSIFENFENKEKQAQELYSNLIKNTESENIKEIFEKLLQDELSHQRFFNEIDYSVFSEVSSDDLNRIIFDKKQEVINLEKLNDLLDFAISQEQLAHDNYLNLAKLLPLSETKKTLIKIADQESFHKIVLQKLKLDLNNNDWSKVFKKN